MHVWLLYVLGGALMALSFPLAPFPGGSTWGLWPCGWLCLAPLLAASSRPGSVAGAALGGLAAGFAAFVPVLAWMYPFLARWGMLSPPEAGGIYLLLVFWVALFMAAFTTLVRLWSARWGPVAAIAMAPAAWVALELGRGRMLTGFPWCLLGYSQARLPTAIQVANLGGVYAVSFLLACAGSALALIWLALGREVPFRRALPPAGALAAVAMAGVAYGLAIPGDPDVGPEPVHVALVQANVAQSEKWDPQERARIEADHVRLTREAAAQGARLIVWSESSVPASITSDRRYAERLDQLARETGSDLVVGTVAYEMRGARRVPFNSAVLIGPEGMRGSRYDKEHLVPFGEYVPLRRLLFFVEPLVQEAGDFEPGGGGPPLPATGIPLGPLICYEAVFPELTRARVRSGADALVNLTNDAWYGDTAMPRQHLSMAILRAVESRRWLLRCANTGLSALVDPRGRVRGLTRLDETTVLHGEVAPVREISVYVRAGDAFAIACGILTAASTIAVLRRRPSPAGNRRPTQNHAS